LLHDGGHGHVDGIDGQPGQLVEFFGDVAADRGGDLGHRSRVDHLPRAQAMNPA